MIEARNADPTLDLDLTATEPPNYSQSFLEIDKPSPIPFVFKALVLSIVPKRLNNLICSSGFKPIPES